MKRSFLSTKGAALLLGGSLAFASVALAAKTGEVKVTGNVPVTCDITVQQDSGAVSIPDISQATTNRTVVTVTESCNSRSGYRVSIATSNGRGHTGLFVDTASGDTQPFTITYGGTAVSQSVVTEASTVANGVQKIVAISYTAKPSLAGTTAATYAETITFTIAAR